MLTKGPHGLGKVVPSASRDRERSRRRARSTQAPADAAPDDTSKVGFWTANYAERLRSIDFKGAAEHVESEIRRLGILYDSWEEMLGTEGRIHHEMWVSYKTVSHFNIGTALELMLKLILHLQNIPIVSRHVV